MIEQKRIALVGNGTTTRQSDGFDGDIWTTASVAKILPRVDLVFEIHKKGEDASYDPDRLNSYGCPIMTDGVYSELKHSVDLGIDSLVKKYRPVFQFSYDYMMAYALETVVKHITLFGIDLATEQEYTRYQRSFLYWIGRAEGSGVTVEVSEGSLILSQDWQYCHKKNFPKERLNNRMKLIQEKQAESDRLLDEAVSRSEWLRGYRECLEETSRIGD